MSFLSRLIASSGKAVVGALINHAASELRDPEKRQKIGESVQSVATTATHQGARALGRMVGKIQNAIAKPNNDE
jgi:hypothetical protein